MNTKQRDLAAASALSATSAAESGQLFAGSARASDTPGGAILRAVALVAVYSALAALYTWPLASHLGQGLISSLDSLDSVWRVARGQQQLLHAPAHLYKANVFYLFNHTYLLDELILGAAILALPFRLFTQNPLTIYNLAILSSFVLSALGMYALSRRLGAHRAGAFAAGLVYAFAPFRLDHLPHLGLLSGQYFPLIIVLLDWLFAAPPAVARWRDALALTGAGDAGAFGAVLRLLPRLRGRRVHCLACRAGSSRGALALGPGLYLTANPDTLIWSHMPYGFLLIRVPGFDSMRVPARINALYSLSIAGLASLGLTWVLDRLAQARLPHLSASNCPSRFRTHATVSS